jgi:hypothetical protein
MTGAGPTKVGAPDYSRRLLSLSRMALVNCGSSRSCRDYGFVFCVPPACSFAWAIKAAKRGSV